MGHDRSYLHSACLQLLSEVQLCDDRAVTLDVNLLEIAEKISSVADHLLQASAAVEVLGVGLEVLGQVSDSLGASMSPASMRRPNSS